MNKFVNQTRTSRSIPRKLLKEGKLYLLPLYYLFLLSELAREGITNSGSYHFADHIYIGKPKGKLLIGKTLDALLLRMRSARSFRNRYIHSRDELLRAIHSLRQEKEIHILSIPSGVPRDLMEVATQLSVTHPPLLKKVLFHCMDLDAQLLSQVRAMVTEKQFANFSFHQGNALEYDHYPIQPHIIVSTGLGEFLTEKELLSFYTTCHKVLKNNGMFITTATKEDTLSNYLMKNLGELTAYYRSKDDMQKLFKRTKFSDIKIYNDTVGLQTIIIARK